MANDYISQITLPNNSTYDFRDKNLKLYTGSCATAAGTAIKDVTTDGTFTLEKGAVIFVNFTNTNSATAANLKLKLNGEADANAKPIKYLVNGNDPANIPGAGYLRANQTYMFRYDGTNWVADLNYYTYSNDFASRVGHYNNILARKAIAAESLIVGDETGYEKVASGVTFNLAYPIVWCTGAVNANASNYANMFLQHYDRNIATGAKSGFTSTANKAIYLIVTINGNIATIDSNIITDTLPSSDDGKVYISLGKLGAQSTGANYFFLYPVHPMFWYKNGAIREYSGASQYALTAPLSGISGADDLKAIEALTGTSGLLKKTAANTWTLDTSSYSTTTGTVTSVRVQASSPLISSSSAASSSTLSTTISFANQNANLVLAGPSSGSAAAPTFRSLVAADIPDLSWNKITSDKPAYTTRWPTWDEVTSKPSSFTPASHTHYELATIGDKRSENTTPNTYANRLIFQGLKTNTQINSPYTDTYSYLVGLRGWSDSSGGNSHELAFNGDGIYRRQGATTTWGNWFHILDSNNTSSGTNNAATLTWSTTYTIAKINGTDIKFTTMAKPSYSYSDISSRPTSIKLTGAVTGSVTLGNGENSIATTVNHNHDDRYKIASGVITLGSSTITPVTSVNGHTGASVSVTASDLGLASALKYVGTKSSLPTATDSTTYSTYNNGDVITVSNKEYAYVKGSNAAGSSWVELGDEGSYKLKQTAFTNSTGTADGSNTSTTFIYSFSQDANGVITDIKTRKLPTYNNYSHPTGDGNLHVPATGTGNNGKFLKAGSTAGSLSWATLTVSDISNIASTYLKLDGSNNMTADVNIITGDTDKFVNFWYNTNKTAGASWRIGMLGSGSGDTNYFVIQSGTNDTSVTTWNNAVRIGQNTYNVYLPGTTASTSTTSGALTVEGGAGIKGQLTATRLAANGSNTSYNLYVNGNSYLNGTTYGKGFILFNSNAVDSCSLLASTRGLAPTATTTDGNTTYSGAVVGTSILTLGNNKIGANSASGVNDNAKGYLRIYGASSGYGELTYNDSMFASTKSIYLTNTANSGINNEIRGITATNDYWRVAGGATASNAGYMELATADDQNEPIYVRQYSGVFATLKRTATLLDASGNTEFPVQVTAPKFIGALQGNADTATSAGKWTTARTLTIGSTGKSVDGSGDVSWSLADIGAAASSHEHNYIGNNRYIAYTSDGHYEGSGTVTGYVKIKIPKTKSATMLSFDVDIYNYVDNTTVRYHIAGYNYTNASWNAVTAYCIAPLSNAKANLTVRFLSNGNDEMYVTIGETNTSWSYPKVSVHNIILGHSGNALADWKSGWTITFSSDAFDASLVKTSRENTNIAYQSQAIKTGVASYALTHNYLFVSSTTTAPTSTTPQVYEPKATLGMWVNSADKGKFELVLGTATANSSSGGQYGQLALYSASSAGTYLKSENATSWTTATLQAKTGTIALTSDITVTSVTATGTSPLTLSASITSKAVTITGSVAEGSSDTAGVVKLGATGGAAAYSHSHGNIGSGGTLGSTASYGVATDANKKIIAIDLSVSNPTASGNATTFVTSVTQSSQGKISVSRSTVPNASSTTAGIVKLGAEGGAATYSHTHSYLSSHGPSYGGIQISAQSTTTTTLAGGTSAVTVTAAGANETVKFITKNKWIVVKGSNSSTSGSDEVQFAHVAGLTAKTSYCSTSATASANGGKITVTDIQYDEAGHITSTTDRTITLSQTTYTLSSLGAASSTHVHGNISNTGTISTSAAPLNGDAIVISTSANNGLVKKTTITFDASTTTSYLNKKGEWGTPPDTKNTAGATNSTSALYLIGSTTQTANPQTYSNTYVTATNGVLSAKSFGVNFGTAANKVTLEWNNTDSALEFVFA